MDIIERLKIFYRKNRDTIGFAIIAISSISIGINWCILCEKILEINEQQILYHIKINILMILFLIIGFEILIQKYKIDKDYKVNVLDLLVKQTKERISKLPKENQPNTNEHNNKTNGRNE